MLSSLRSIVEPREIGSQDLVARTFFASVEADLVVAGAMAGVPGMLACLNARTRYRFTGIYPLAERGASRGAHVRIAHLYDRELPGPTNADDTELARIARGIVAAERAGWRDDPRAIAGGRWSGCRRPIVGQRRAAVGCPLPLRSAAACRAAH